MVSVILNIECTDACGEVINIQKKICSLLLLFLLFFLCSCGTDSVVLVSEYDNSQNCLENVNFFYKQDKNYEILSNKEQTIFYYVIKDDNGYIIDEGYHNERGSFDINQNDEFLTMNYGYGGNVWYDRYYDISNGRVSRFFERPIQNSNELVAYFVVQNSDNSIVLVIQNKFDKSDYYKEIRRDFSDFVIKDEVKTDFLENNTKLKISYWIKPDNKQITEIIDL